MAQWKIGDRIQNRWEIYRILGGGMGIVYIVYDHEWHEPFALKTFQDDIFAQDPKIATSFEWEALAWVNLDVHQNITQARFVQTIEGKPFLFLEFVSGGDLSDWIGTPRLMQDLPQVLSFAIQLCDGMIHAMSKGIKAHRDIKPKNCLITQDNTLKVTDFGLAKIFDETRMGESGRESQDRRQEAIELSTGMTCTGEGAGTREYIAPEQFDDVKHVDVRADIYSFGIMLFEMVTGRLPFEGGTWEEFERLHKNQAPPSLPATLPADLASVIHTCLSKDPSHRFEDFSSVRERLARSYEALTRKPAPQPVAGTQLDAEQLSNKGASLCELGRVEDAMACYDRAIEIDPRYAPAWYNKGDALLNLGR
jgi:serine/threonine protein kinase